MGHNTPRVVAVVYVAHNFPLDSILVRLLACCCVQAKVDCMKTMRNFAHPIVSKSEYCPSHLNTDNVNASTALRDNNHVLPTCKVDLGQLMCSVEAISEANRSDIYSLNLQWPASTSY